MADIVEFIIWLIFESWVTFGGPHKGDFLAETIGCLGGSVLYAMTGGRLDLENHDWRSLLLGWFLVLGILAGAGGLFWALLR
jgi:hypothetical protein